MAVEKPLIRVLQFFADRAVFPGFILAGLGNWFSCSSSAPAGMTAVGITSVLAAGPAAMEAKAAPGVSLAIIHLYNGQRPGLQGETEF